MLLKTIGPICIYFRKDAENTHSGFHVETRLVDMSFDTNIKRNLTFGHTKNGKVFFFVCDTKRKTEVCLPSSSLLEIAKDRALFGG